MYQLVTLYLSFVSLCCIILKEGQKNMHASKVFLILILHFQVITAINICNVTEDCGVDSECENGKCTNPFEMGCLRYMAKRDGNIEKEFRIRACNSDDKALNSTNCRVPNFDYVETRISLQNWDMAIAFAWIYQILLSEVLGVPTTLEFGEGKRDGVLSFYERDAQYKYPSASYPMDQLETAHLVNGDCEKTTAPCSHIMPDVWDGGKSDARPYQESGSILPHEMNGVVGRFGLYIPYFTVQQDLSLLHFIGLSGEENRQKLAERFLTPTNLTYYCEHISNDNCETPDNFTKRAPLDENEGGSFYIDDIYKGYFRMAESNNCTENPNCVGHIVIPSCGWSTYTESQFYWNKIYMASSGPLYPNHGYSYGHMIQIYQAASITESDVMIWWWEPDLAFMIYEDTPAAPQRIILPRPTMECNKYRESDKIIRCSEILEERLGTEPTGSCDQESARIVRLYSNGFLAATESDSISLRSPAMKYLQRVIMPQYGSIELLQQWATLSEQGAHFAEREGVCQFVYDNLDVLDFGAPEGYPLNRRTLAPKALGVVGIVLGTIAVIGAVTTFYLVQRWRKERVMLYAQPNVLLLVVVGYFFIGIAAISGASEPSHFTCVFTQWCTRLGYTLELVPILLKVSAINKLTREARRLRRTKVEPKRFQRILSSIVFLLLVYLSIWTGVDKPRQEMVHTLDAIDSTMLVSSKTCASKSDAWELGAFAWECMLLLSATILTYQSRDVIEELNESSALALMVYSHFIFLLLRCLFTILNLTMRIPSIFALKAISLLLGLDTIIAMCVYFTPKFYSVIINDARNSHDSRTRRGALHGSFATSKFHSGNGISGFSSRSSHNQDVGNFDTRRHSVAIVNRVAAATAAAEIKVSHDVLKAARKGNYNRTSIGSGSLDSESESTARDVLARESWIARAANDPSEAESTTTYKPHNFTKLYGGKRRMSNSTSLQSTNEINNNKFNNNNHSMKEPIKKESESNDTPNTCATTDNESDDTPPKTDHQKINEPSKAETTDLNATKSNPDVEKNNEEIPDKEINEEENKNNVVAQTEISTDDKKNIETEINNGDENNDDAPEEV